MIRIDEATMAYLIKKAQAETPSVFNRVASQNLTPKYVRTAGNGIIYLRVNSGTKPGVSYSQQLKFVNDFKLMRKYTVNSVEQAQELVRAMMKGDVLFWSSDASFKYWAWQYLSQKKGYSLRKTPVPAPTRNNVNLAGALNKHGIAAMLNIEQFIPQITQDLINAKRIKIDPEAPEIKEFTV